MPLKSEIRQGFRIWSQKYRCYLLPSTEKWPYNYLQEVTYS